MGDIDVRVKLAARRGIRARIILIIWLGAIVPLLVIALYKTLGLSSDPVFFSLWFGAFFLIYYSGQSWKNGSRVQALLDEAESAIVVFPAGRPHTPAAWRTVRGCFVVLTERRILVFAYNRLLDTPTGLLRSADLGTASAELRSDGRLLTIAEGGHRMGFRVAERRRKTTADFVSKLG
ncbi:hypothetical protein [Streptomyces sp. bgisy027]|uniref:hypothetical protein n=1 Tax=Streptomyces sp. bgisy027 TaxID=3413770 RepID=UPI003D70FDF3